MFRPKKTIPHAALIALALGGCSSGEPPTDAARANDVSIDLCRKMRECDPEEFAYDFDSIDQCATETAAGLLYYSSNTDCFDAYIDYYHCLARASCDALYDEYSTVCEVEGFAVIAACGDDYYGD